MNLAEATNQVLIAMLLVTLYLCCEIFSLRALWPPSFWACFGGEVARQAQRPARL